MRTRIESMREAGRMRLRLFGSSLFVGLFTVLATTNVFAQKTTGDISGTVTDSTGGVVPGGTVTAVCLTTNATRTSVTDAQGGFTMPELAVCVYRVQTELPGFKSVAREVQVAVNTVTKADFKLEVGAQSETITVQAASPLVEFTDKLNNNVDTERIQQIPLSGRDFNSLLGVTPGVQHDPGGGFPRVSISGARRTSNNYMIDGISNNDRYYGDSVLNQTGVVGVPATLVPMDAIAEFTVQQTPSAEFGTKGGAAINVVMKSGTNSLHGSAHMFYADDFANAANFFSKSTGPEGCTGSACGEKTPFKNKQFGATIGGPIIKDKTFFFGYYEGQRLSVISPYTAPVPTPGEVAEARARIAKAGLRPSPIGENLLKYYPTDPSGNVSVNAPTEADMNTFSMKLDHRINRSNQLSLRYFYGTSDQSAPATVGELVPPASSGLQPDAFNSVAKPSTVHLAGLTWTSTFANNKVWETRVGFTRFGQVLGEQTNKVDPKSLGLDTGPLDPLDF